ncbi:hypothetical protein AMS68_001546 [Peltaster fructicola]|uniref:PNPLA domain-containing protein n=1 Tax=Peltaster fructicola TaxID=286661 RepID=A0A6H0XN30_9PEZI|nr:hypothetical protein AMS68_001546 [Peltaster fructicola]
MDEASRLRRKDTTKGAPLRILSLDGGGVRGYSIFIILQELMHRTFVEIHGRAPRRDEIPKPCDHFDLIGGTGTGGLVAIMLGRLRMDIETCKDVYVRMTRRVFQTDKTIVGIPYRSTLFKASKLEEAIRDCVREHTIYEDEGNDVLSSAVPMTPEVMSSPGPISPDGIPQRSMSQSSRYSQVGRSPTSSRASLSFGSVLTGNANALLYDVRENRTKTAVTAVFKGTRGAESTVLLRSYDSRREPAPDVNCTIWQAGRATSATGLAFKPIQIGQYVYHDDGSGEFNPSPTMLDEATQNEWPGREVGLFVSIGTGKRPGSSSSTNQAEWWEGFMGGTMGAFAEARRRLISKIEGCENTHLYMLREHCAARGVNPENYYRFNVEVGVGEFAMNEWSRLGEISTSTRMYLSKHDVQSMNINAAGKLAKAHFAEVRQRRAEARHNLDGNPRVASESSWDIPQAQVPPPSNSTAVELPGDELFGFTPSGGYPSRNQYEHRPSIADQKYTVIAEDTEAGAQVPPSQHIDGIGLHNNGYTAAHRPVQEVSHRSAVPPLPPKLPYPEAPHSAEINYRAQHINHNGSQLNMSSMARVLPYPDLDGPPPPVNTANKPQLRR